jgi:hypothetical protein
VGPLTALLVAAAALAGCSAADGSSGADAGAVCSDAFVQVAAIDPSRATPTDLDLAIRRCRSLTDWLAAAAAHPEALRGASPVDHLEDRCAVDTGLAGYTLCGMLRVAAGTATPAPTRRPTPRPTKAPPRSIAMWDTYRAHVYEVEARGVNLVYRVLDGIQRTTFRSIRPVVGPMQDLQRWADREAKWLDRHPAHKCYAHVQRAWRRGVGLVAQAARLALPGFRQRDESKVTRSGELLVQAGRSFELAERRFQRLGPTGCD